MRPAAGLEQVDELGAGVGVAAERVAQAGSGLALADQLRGDVAALLEDIARREGVVGGDVVALRVRGVQVAAGLEEELLDLHVRRQPVGTQVEHVVEIGAVAIDALQEGPEDARFQLRRGHRLLQRERGEDRELEVRVGFGARIERVQQLGRLAEAERHADAQVVPEPGDQGVDGSVAAGERGGGGHGRPDERFGPAVWHGKFSS